MAAAQEIKSEKIWLTDEWLDLAQHVEVIKQQHLRDLLTDKNSEERNKILQIHDEKIFLDLSRQQANTETLSKLIALAKKANLQNKIKAMFNGEKINITENRCVLHVALRQSIQEVKDDEQVNKEVQEVPKVLKQIEQFSDKVRSGDYLGFSGKKINNIICIGIGGSYLGTEFVFEALKTDPIGRKNSLGKTLRFYANIDPIGFARAVKDISPENTIAIIISKTFTTRETLMNGDIIKQWFIEFFKDEKCLNKHMIAATSNIKGAQDKFNINPNYTFNFWDWVGGRYSVTSAVGILPLSLHYGYDVMKDFLQGAHDMDQHFLNTPMEKNIPILLGLFGIWNASFLNYGTRALIPYCEALNRLSAHIQQLDMESNGKRVLIDGNKIPFDVGEINFGEPGTNAQHSFFQLIHQGRIIPVDFIGFTTSQLLIDEHLYNKEMKHLIYNNHDELMSNYFAQADALAFGKTLNEVKKDNQNQNISEQLLQHKVFNGNRPSTLLLFNNYLNAYTCGQILSLFEHRTAVEGFIWGINSFDQWGVELGKVLGKKIRNSIDNYRNNKELVDDKNYSKASANVMNYYLKHSQL